MLLCRLCKRKSAGDVSSLCFFLQHCARVHCCSVVTTLHQQSLHSAHVTERHERPDKPRAEGFLCVNSLSVCNRAGKDLNDSVSIVPQVRLKYLYFVVVFVFVFEQKSVRCNDSFATVQQSWCSVQREKSYRSHFAI